MTSEARLFILANIAKDRRKPVHHSGKALDMLYAITAKADRSKLLATANSWDEAKAKANELNGDIRLYTEAKRYFR